MTAGSRSFATREAPLIRGETAGAGPAVLLCHGITATRRYVIHGSRALERAGHTVITFDARGHGESEPAPEAEGYGYPELVGDLERVVAATVGDESRFVLGGHSMGAHTAVAYALRHPERLHGLVLIGPVYMGSIEDGSLDYWDGLALALREGGVDGFVTYIDRQGIDPRWRDSVLRFTRERMLRHQHPEALVRALREVPRSRPFERLEDLGRLRLPALVVASHDEADPGHPREAAEAYAEHLPSGRLIGEERGESPLAWQGGRLSRAIAAFCARLDSSEMLGSGR